MRNVSKEVTLAAAKSKTCAIRTTSLLTFLIGSAVDLCSPEGKI